MKTCGTVGCDKRIDTFCLICKRFMCKSCQCQHDKQYMNHKKSAITIGGDDSLKAFCQNHQTVCEFMCNINNNWELACVYCVHRDHRGHGHHRLRDEIANVRKSLNKAMKTEKLHELIYSAMGQNISVAQNVFREVMTSLKRKCVEEYIVYLNNEEERLEQQLAIIICDYQDNLSKPKSVDELKTLFEKSDIELSLLKKNIDEVIKQSNTSNIFHLSLSEAHFSSEHPLGDLTVEVSEVNITDEVDLETFRLKTPEVKESNQLLQELLNLDGKFF